MNGEDIIDINKLDKEDLVKLLLKLLEYDSQKELKQLKDDYQQLNNKYNMMCKFVDNKFKIYNEKITKLEMLISTPNSINNKNKE